MNGGLRPHLIQISSNIQLCNKKNAHGFIKSHERLLIYSIFHFPLSIFNYKRVRATPSHNSSFLIPN